MLTARFIPKCYMEKESDHLDDFAPELAMVTKFGNEEFLLPHIKTELGLVLKNVLFFLCLFFWLNAPKQWISLTFNWEFKNYPNYLCCFHLFSELISWMGNVGFQLGFCHSVSFNGLLSISTEKSIPAGEEVQCFPETETSNIRCRCRYPCGII